MVEDALDDLPLMSALREALAALWRGDVIQPQRTVMPFSAHHSDNTQAGHGTLFIKPIQWKDRITVKLISLVPSNAQRHLPGLLSTLAVLDAQTGMVIAFMQANALTARRTAAVSAIAADLLAKPGRCRLALLGSGVLAHSHAALMRKVREIDDIRVWSPTKANARACAQAIGAAACDSAQDAVVDADIVCTLTHAQEPVLMGKWLKHGAFVAAVGAPRPDWRELDDEAMSHPVVADMREAALKESGDVIGSGATIVAELGQLLAQHEQPSGHQQSLGPHQQGRLVDQQGINLQGQTVIFKSLGLAIQDAVAADLVLRATSRKD